MIRAAWWSAYPRARFHVPSPTPRAARNEAGALLRCVADGFDVVPIGVTHEAAVVGGVVFGPQPGLMQHLGARIHRCLVERPDRGPVARSEGDVRLAEPLAGGPRADPELGPGRHTVADDFPEVHHPASTERAEHSVVELRAGGHVSALDGKVIKHEAILAHHAPSLAGGASWRA